MITEDGKVTLETIGGGVIPEKFQVEFARILENINDPNTTLEERVITIQVKIKPTYDRTWFRTKIECKSKLAQDSPYETNHFIGLDAKGNPFAYEHTPHKQNPIGELTGFNNVTIMKGGKNND